MAILAGCERFPQDPNDALEKIHARGTLRVGVMFSEPWVTGSAPGKPGGLEGRLIAAFSEELGVDLETRWASEEDLFDSLAHYELDVVIGGFTQDNPWRSHVGFSHPYYTSRSVIGVPENHHEVITSADGVNVAVRPYGGLKRAIERRGGRAVERESLDDVKGPIAAEEWEIAGMGFRSTGIELRDRKHVIAVAPGENALLMALEAFLMRNHNTGIIPTTLWEESRR